MDNKVHTTADCNEALVADKEKLPALQDFLDTLEELNKLSPFERKAFVKKLIEEL